MPTLAPGPAFLLTRLLPLLTASLTALTALNLLLPPARRLSLPVQLLTILALSVLALPVSATVRGYAQRARAAMRGAVLPPVVPYRWPGGMDVILAMTRGAKTQYIGERIAMYTRQLGETYTLYGNFEHRIITTEPEYIKAILATDFANFEKGPSFQKQQGTLLGTGVFNSDGEMWKFHRGITRPYFSRDRISHFDIFNRHAEDAIAQARARLRAGHALDFQDLVARFTLDSATEFLFGRDIHSLDAGLPYPASTTTTTTTSASPNSPNSPHADPSSTHPANLFVRAFADAQKASSERGRYGALWPLREMRRDAVGAHMGPIDAFLRPLIEGAIRARGSKDGDGEKEGEGEEGESLLEHLVRITDDYKIIKDETLNIMLAGRDTTATTLTFCVYLLSQHPAVLRRLRAEILDTVGSARGPTLEELREMKYLRAVINETLRLFPPVPFNTRTAIRDTVWPSKVPGRPPFFVPAGTRCVYSVFMMHRRKDLWGPDALEFDPDRFLDARLGKYLTPNPFIFVPFNAGPRICLGQQFAYNEVSFMLTRLLQAFSGVALAPDAQPAASHPPRAWAALGGRAAVEKVWPRSHLTMYAAEGLWVRMEEAPAAETESV
ncbi:cytochrome P450 [Dentipellis sp. KUC8613]|nr:cytochrome P450 [Dentipellis sp. KUC8613]